MEIGRMVLRRLCDVIGAQQGVSLQCKLARRRGSHSYDWAALVREYIHISAALSSRCLVKAYNSLFAVHCKLQGCLVSALYQVSRSSTDALASTSGALNTMRTGYGSRGALRRL